MKFVLQPSLELMSLVKIVLSLWNQNDVRALMAKLNLSRYKYSTELHAEWSNIEDRVRAKVPQLSLPQLLKEKVLDFVKPIGLEVLMWMKYNHTSLNVNLPVELRWTPQFTVDRKKTAELLVKNENLDMSTRYKLACIYCLEDDIYELWSSVTGNIMKSLSHANFHVINYWTCNMVRSRLGNAHIFYKDYFYQCTIHGNKVAAEYFLQKLTPREREEVLVNAAKYVEDADTLCYLISEMGTEQQMEVFKHNPYKVLQSFLKWPFQSFFIGIANCVWDFLSKKHYAALLKDIIDKHVRGYKDWNYQQLFGEFWQKSPNALKSFITDEIDKSCLLRCLFDIKDKENIRIILKHATPTVKEKLMYNYHIMQFCHFSILDDEWDFLQFCIRECLPSKTAMLKFKIEFEKLIIPCNFKKHFATKKHKWDKLFSFSDDSICMYDKRKVEKDGSSSSKRFHSMH